MRERGQREDGESEHRVELGMGDLAGEARERVADRHADQDAEEPEPSLVPDVEPDHRGQADAGDQRVAARDHVAGGMEEQELKGGELDDHADQQDDHAGDLGRDEDAQPRPDAREADLDGAGEHGHAPDQRQAAELCREERGGEIDAGEDRRGEEAAADGPAGQRLEDGGDREDQHGDAEDGADLGGRGAGRARDDQRIDHEDRDHAHVLEGADDGDGDRRLFLGAVNEIGRLFHCSRNSPRPGGLFGLPGGRA